MQKAQDWIAQYRKFWEGSLNALAEYLESENQPTPTKKKKGKKT